MPALPTDESLPLILDLLVAHQVVQDNSCVVSITSGWDDHIAGGRLQVDVKRVR
jgi:hypothetical protein